VASSSDFFYLEENWKTFPIENIGFFPPRRVRTQVATDRFHLSGSRKLRKGPLGLAKIKLEVRVYRNV
jgi:hypothetical protein